MVYLEASVRLVSDPNARVLLLLGYPSIYDAADHIPELMAHKPIGLEGMDDRLVKDIQRAGRYTDTLNMLPEGKGWLLVEFGGDSKQDADAKAFSVMAELERMAGAPTMFTLDESGKPKVHAHVVLGKSDGTAHGGHLLEGWVRPTLEVVPVESERHLRRRMNVEVGLPLIDASE